jgi:sarcosine oxidase delta subunit
MEKTSKNECKYYCKTCDFESRWKSDWTRHLGTSKHLNQPKSTVVNNMSTEETTKTSNNNSNFVCKNCSKTYKDRSGLWRHTKTCKEIFNIIEPSDSITHDIIDDKIESNQSQQSQSNLETTEVIMAVLKDNKELKTMLAEQNNKILELISAKNTITNNITTNKTVNNQFNLNLFLNETCRDAMNINEFIENIQIQTKELENVGNNGYITGITDIILSRLKQLDVSKRPLHCTDIKRETLYIKDQNEWNRDTEEKTKIKTMITKIAKKNLKQIPVWREQNPECKEPENEKYDFCIKIMRNSLGEIGDEQIKLDEKIIKNIAKQVIVDKNI